MKIRFISASHCRFEQARTVNMQHWALGCGPVAIASFLYHWFVLISAYKYDARYGKHSLKCSYQTFNSSNHVHRWRMLEEFRAMSWWGEDLWTTSDSEKHFSCRSSSSFKTFEMLQMLMPHLLKCWSLEMLQIICLEIWVFTIWDSSRRTLGLTRLHCYVAGAKGKDFVRSYLHLC